MIIPIERIIDISFWLILIPILLIFLPKEKTRDAHVIFLFTQVFTWVLGHLVVELHLIEYPIRLFEYATKTSFTFEYFVNPALNVLIILFYPERKKWYIKLAYFISFISLITLIEASLEKYTELINYLNWQWYWSWLTLFMTSYITLLYYRWFFRKR